MMLQKHDLSGLKEKKEELRSIILNRGIVFPEEKGKIKRGGWASDTKLFLLDPKALKITIDLFLEKITKYSPDAVGGLTLASHIIASGIAYGSNTEAFLVRRERKDYDLRKIIEGPLKKGSKVIILDDFLNEAGFAHQAIERVKEHGCEVLGVVVLINNEKGDYEKLKGEGIGVESIFTLKELGLDSRVIPSDEDLYRLKWRHEGLNGSDYTATKSIPLIEEGRIYVGSDKSKVLAFDLCGKVIWEFKTDPQEHGVHASVTIAKEKVIAAGYDGSVYAIDKENGSLIWKSKISNWIGSSPIYDEKLDRIYVGTENSTKIGCMASLDAKSGEMSWELSTHDHVPGKATFNENVLIFGSNDGIIYAADKKSGAMTWKFQTGGELKGRPLIDKDHIYITSFDGNLYCLDLKGKLAWKRKIGSKIFCGPLIVGEMVYVASFSNQVIALEKESGKIIWFFTCSGQIQGPLNYKDGLLYFGSYDKHAYIIDAKSGALVWKKEVGGPINSSLVPYEDLLFVAAMDGTLYCFEKNKP